MEDGVSDVVATVLTGHRTPTVVNLGSLASRRERKREGEGEEDERR